MNLYETNDTYICHISKDREEWLEKRTIGIGGSDSSIFIGRNPYKTNHQLWQEKMGIVKPKQLSSAAIDHGNDLEPVLRDWFKATHKDYEVQYIPNAIFQSKKREWQLYSPDGLLFHEEKGKGIAEYKTTLIQNMNMYMEWKDAMPMHYFVQVLHGLLTLEDFNFVNIVAELRFAWERNTEIVELEFTREEVLEDLKFLLEKEVFNWNEYYLNKKEPPTVLIL